jgi:hypothetical protein
MNNLLFSFLIPFMTLFTPADSTIIDTDPTFDKENCTCKGIPLYGKVRVMDNSFADFDVRITNGYPDLDVEVVKAFPNECGKWEFVEGFEDFTVRFVEGFEDFTIRFVDGIPGTK